MPTRVFHRHDLCFHEALDNIASIAVLKQVVVRAEKNLQRFIARFVGNKNAPLMRDDNGRAIGKKNGQGTSPLLCTLFPVQNVTYTHLAKSLGNKLTFLEVSV